MRSHIEGHIEGQIAGQIAGRSEEQAVGVPLVAVAL